MNNKDSHPMTTEITKAGETLPDKELVASELDRLQAQGDTVALNEAARTAKAYQEYEKRAHAKERANYFGTIKVMAEARIGSIDLDLHSGVRDSRLIFDSVDVPQSTRSRWRTLGHSLRAGQLEAAIRNAEERFEAVHTAGVVSEAYALGGWLVSSEPLAKRFQELRRTEGLTIPQVAVRIGMDPGNLRNYLAGSPPKLGRMKRDNAYAIAGVLGVDPSELKGTPMQVRRGSSRKRAVRRERTLPGGRLDKTYEFIRKALQELDRATEGTDRWHTGAAWQHLYEAEDIVGKALRLAAVSDMPQYQRKTPKAEHVATK